MRLNKKELIHPIFIILFIVIVPGISFNSVSHIFHQGFQENLKLSVYAILFFLLYNILNISRSVEVKHNDIIDGIHIPIFGFVKIKNRIHLKDIKELVIHQNDKKYREIRAISNNGDFLIIKTIANKIPAEEELQKIKTILKP